MALSFRGISVSTVGMDDVMVTFNSINVSYIEELLLMK